jgi:alkylated DNA nucleotide flippase Atl1
MPEVASRVLDVVDRVPPGEVVTYGEVARAIGLASARQVGQVMARYGHETCWHRVVHAGGWLPVAVQAEAERRLLAEGVVVLVVGGRRRVRLEPGGRAAR